MRHFIRAKGALALFMIGLLAVPLPGGAVFAETPEILVEGTTVYARGIPIVIKAVKDKDAVTGEDSEKVFVFDAAGKQLSDVDVRGGTVYGGGKNEDVDGSTSVTVENAYLSHIYGGGYSDGTASANVNGNTSVKVTGTIVANANGGGYAEGKKGTAQANVSGTARLDIPSIVPSPNTGFTEKGHSLQGGGKAFAGNFSAQATVGETWVRSTGPIYVIRGGGTANRSSGSQELADADVPGLVSIEAEAADIREVYGGGSAAGSENHADTGSVSIFVGTSEVMIIQGGGDASDHGSAKVEGTVQVDVVDCPNLYGYVLAGGDASGGGSAPVGETQLNVTGSTIPVEEQFGGLAAAAVYGGGNASGADSQADVLGAAKTVLKDCTGAGTVYGGGSVSSGGQANVGSVDLTISSYTGDRSFNPGQAYFPSIIGGGEISGDDSSAEVLNGIQVSFDKSEAEMVVGGNLKAGAPLRSKAGKSVIRFGSDQAAAPALAYFDQLELAKALTINGFLPVPEGPAEIMLSGDSWKVSDTAIKALDSDAEEGWFTLPKGSLNYSKTSDSAVWIIEKLPASTPDQGGDSGGGNGGSGGGSGNSGSSGGNGGSADSSSKPSNSGESTVVQPESKVEQGKAQSTVSDSTAKELGKEAEANGSGQIVIAPKINEEVSRTEVELPKEAISEAARESGASVVVETPVAAVTLSPETLERLENQKGETLSIAAERGEDRTIHIEVRVGNSSAANLAGGIRVEFPQEETAAGFVVVLVEEDGAETILPKSAVLDGMALALLDGSATLKVVDRGIDFPDLSEHWAQSAGEFVSAHQLFAGTEAGQFEPEGSMTRGMIVSVLHRLEGDRKGIEGELSFTDLDPQAFYAGDVSWAAGQGLIAGNENGEFQGELGVSREELASVLMRYVRSTVGSAAVGESEKNLSDFPDAEQISPWAQDDLLLAVQIGLLNGTDEGMLNPQGAATRAETAVIFERLVEWMVKN